MSNLHLPPSLSECLLDAYATRDWTVVLGEETPLPANDGFHFRRHHFNNSMPCSSTIKELDEWMTRMRISHPDATRKVVRVSGPRWKDTMTGENMHLLEAFALIPPQKSLLRRALDHLC